MQAAINLSMKAGTILVSLILTFAGVFPALSMLLADEPETLFKQGMLAEKDGDYDTAIIDYTQVLQAVPKTANVLYRRSAAYMAKGDYVRAIADLNQVIQINPKHAAAYNDLAGLAPGYISAR